MDGKSEEQKPRRTPRQMIAAIRCRSEEDAYPHQALQAYGNLVIMTDLKTVCRTVPHRLWARSVVNAYRVCEHLLTWSLTDSLFEMVTPIILIEDIRHMSGSNGGWVSWHFLILSIITISADLLRLRVKLLAFAHSSMLSSSRVCGIPAKVALPWSSRVRRSNVASAVSYTHLTLPTILRV